MQKQKSKHYVIVTKLVLNTYKPSDLDNVDRRGDTFACVLVYESNQTMKLFDKIKTKYFF